MWKQENIRIWPHVAAEPNPETAAKQIANANECIENGIVCPGELTCRNTLGSFRCEFGETWNVETIENQEVVINEEVVTKGTKPIIVHEKKSKEIKNTI